MLQETKGNNLPPIGEKTGGGNGRSGEEEKWVPKNWDHFKKGKNIAKMAPQLKSRFLAVSTQW